MPSIEDSRMRAKIEKLQAHRVKGTLDQYDVYNTVRKTSYRVTRCNGVWRCVCPWSTVGREGFCKHIVRVIDKERREGLEF